MCIMMSKVKKVAKTNILVGRIETREGEPKGMIIYSNAVEFETVAGSKTALPGGMILPVPNPLGRGIDVLELEGKDEELKKGEEKRVHQLFSLLAIVAHPPTPRTRSKSMSRGLSMIEDDEKLEIFTCGSFKYSFAPDCAALDRLQVGELGLGDKRHAACMATVKKRYPEGFGFVAFQLASGTTMLPFGYTFDIPAHHRGIFTPTFHYHEHADPAPQLLKALAQRSRVREVTGLVNPLTGVREMIETIPDEDENQEEVDWDHHIYVMNGTVTNARGIRDKRIITYPLVDPKQYDMSTVNNTFNKLDEILGWKRPTTKWMMTRLRINKTYRKNHDLYVHAYASAGQLTTLTVQHVGASKPTTTKGKSSGVVTDTTKTDYGMDDQYEQFDVVTEDVGTTTVAKKQRV